MLPLLLVVLEAAPKLADESGLKLDLSPLQGGTSCWCAPSQLATDFGCSEDDVPCARVLAHDTPGARRIATGLLIVDGHRVAVQLRGIRIPSAARANIEQLQKFIGGYHEQTSRAVQLLPVSERPGTLIEHEKTRMVRFDFDTVEQKPSAPMELRGYLLGSADELISFELQSTPAGIERVRRRDLQLREALVLEKTDPRFGATREYQMGHSIGSLLCAAFPVGALALVVGLAIRRRKPQRPRAT